MTDSLHEKMSAWGTGMDLKQTSVFVTQPKDMDKLWTDLLSKPRVIKGKDIVPMQHDVFQVRMVDITQVGLETLHCFFEEFSPGGVSQRHGHMNEAVFYILEGKGYDIHDGVRYDWEAGDLVIITGPPEGCVHRHVNADPEHPAKAIVFNPKATFILFNLKAQRLVDRPGEGSY